MSNKLNKTSKKETAALSLLDVLRDKEIFKTEVLGGITGFFAISYILVVNPMILADAGMDVHQTVFATIISSVIGCFIMGFYANSPVVITPGMGVNAFFTYTMVLNMGLSYQEALTVSLVSTIAFALIAFSRFTDVLQGGIPDSLKSAITAGIGLFLVEIGLQKAGLIQQGKNSLLTIGSFKNPSLLLAIFGLILTIVLYIKNVKGNFFIGIVITTIVGIIFHIHDSGVKTTHLIDILQYHKSLFDFSFKNVWTTPFIMASFSMTMILVFESMGLNAGILPDMKKFKKTFRTVSITGIISSILGTSPTVSAAESVAGFQLGARTGIMSITAGIMFLLSTFFISFLDLVPQAAIAPVIIITGALMLSNLKTINMDDFAEWFPAFLIVVLIPLTGSISIGLAFGFVAYPIVKIFNGQIKSISTINYILSGLFLINLIMTAML
ncbi:NCS2 family permease [Lactobacillus kunkeei]|uniref:NCS2 family permease n=1 Tax=Apilactobacillus kunkeei TaxID=148814 RepID=UPI0006C00128|nr:NCS2 family permease [Apilactobacillus kunkeei]MBI0092047.1 NCS2 family permease [Lactobacillus sp. M0345]KOY75454.1 NCS2 family nucleobase:cation symporter-2 [Apilactobacillus kunkeei]NBI00548.1 NCS2 family permease [Apilactobacillus kunkeei]CAI2565400.1 Nucleobase transporter PlAzg2 [Apilactobacillus kunkeei]CAI2565449.1 Nucleobase transporter PlAzg2 [Apilactobacillus kunkeei]